jgi:hypothetical protein
MRASSGHSDMNCVAPAISPRRPATHFLGTADVIGWAIVATTLLALLHEIVQPW